MRTCPSIKDESLKAYVSLADGNTIRLTVVDEAIKISLCTLGFTPESRSAQYELRVSGEQEKAIIFDQLRTLDVCFSAGKEWCPAEVFECMRDKGLLSGSFKKISWRGPDDYLITAE